MRTIPSILYTILKYFLDHFSQRISLQVWLLISCVLCRNRTTTIIGTHVLQFGHFKKLQKFICFLSWNSVKFTCRELCEVAGFIDIVQSLILRLSDIKLYDIVNFIFLYKIWTCWYLDLSIYHFSQISQYSLFRLCYMLKSQYDRHHDIVYSKLHDIFMILKIDFSTWGLLDICIGNIFFTSVTPIFDLLLTS